MENTPKTALPICNPALSLHKTRATPQWPALALQGSQDHCRRSKPEQGRAARPRVDMPPYRGRGSRSGGAGREWSSSRAAWAAEQPGGRPGGGWRGVSKSLDLNLQAAPASACHQAAQ